MTISFAPGSVDATSLSQESMPGTSLHLAVTRPSLMFRACRYWLHSNRAEIAVITDSLREGDVAIDIGAYKGGITYWMAKVVGRTGRVIAFEPQIDLAQYLLRTLNPDFQVTVEPLAVSSGEGKAQLHVPLKRQTSGASLENSTLVGALRTAEVDTVSLDRYLGRELASRVRLIKIDVEGHELSVFQGASDLLRQHHPTLVFECERRHHGGASIAPIITHLRELGYTRSFYLGPQGMQPFEHFEEDKLQIVGKKPYVNMFVFRA